ncbi:hypothetical protein [Methylosarcina fibrata]|uniref:hypothetical protein n=1 Tax=Methylosarcina fibrata TaxID=105972 RepID=UPI0012F85F0D|nr:hypothetical protein [Methylosarcina fibrata]
MSQPSTTSVKSGGSDDTEINEENGAKAIGSNKPKAMVDFNRSGIRSVNPTRAHPLAQAKPTQIVH